MINMRNVMQRNIPEKYLNEWGYPKSENFKFRGVVKGESRWEPIPRENYHRTSCRQCGVVGSEHGLWRAVEYITLENAPGWELAHVRCFDEKCDDDLVGNEPCEECKGWKEPEASRHLIEEPSDEEMEELKREGLIGADAVDLFCHCEEEE